MTLTHANITPFSLLLAAAACAAALLLHAASAAATAAMLLHCRCRSTTPQPFVITARHDFKQDLRPIDSRPLPSAASTPFLLNASLSLQITPPPPQSW